MTTQQAIADETGLSQSTISKIFSGYPVGKRVALRFEALTGTEWVKFLTMPPDDIKTKLTAAMSDRKQQAA